MTEEELAQLRFLSQKYSLDSVLLSLSDAIVADADEYLQGENTDDAGIVKANLAKNRAGDVRRLAYRL